MTVQLQTYPPLGQVSPVASGDNVPLTVALEAPKSATSRAWEISVWHSTDGNDWDEIILAPITSEPKPQALCVTPSNASKAFYSASISFKVSVRFTLKFRQEKEKEWHWIKDEQGFDDGYIVVQPSTRESEKLCDLISNLNSDWSVSLRMSQSPRTQLWFLDTPIAPAQGDASTFQEIEIGKPWGVCSRWFALVRAWSPWLAPRHGKNRFILHEGAILVAFMSPQGRNLVLLAFTDLHDVSTVFQSTKDGAVSVYARNDSSEEGRVKILISEGNNLDFAIASVMYQARNMSSRFQNNRKLNQDLKFLVEVLKPELSDRSHDVLGYCTWNALGQQLTEEKVLEAATQLKKADIDINCFIIDDNWQSLNATGPSQFQYGWTEFEADRKAFPNGLKSTIAKLREINPDIHFIGVWHALFGYWGGLAPGGKIAKSFKTIEVTREEAKNRDIPLKGKITIIAKEDVPRFYDEFYRFLEYSGVDGVKTDAQFMVDMIQEASVRRELIPTYLNAWNVASLRHFGPRTISCMSQIPQALFHTQMLHNRPRFVVRNSDDFFPDVPASHPWHIWTNAHNSIFMVYLNVLSDWDMFQTAHEYAGYHAAARCVSGGPIYITDKPGQYNKDIIAQMTAVTIRGKSILLRPTNSGKALHAYTGYKDQLFLKVGNYTGDWDTGTSILAVFNVSDRPLTELIHLYSFTGTIDSTKYVIRAHTTGMVSEPMIAGEPTSLLAASLDVHGYELFYASPVRSFSGVAHQHVSVSNLGLIGKMTGCVAITSTKVEKRENGVIAATTQVRALGVLGVYISTLPNLDIMKDVMVTLQDVAVLPEVVSVSKSDSRVLEVDIQTAWNKLGLEPSTKSDDVVVKVTFSA